VPPPASAHAGTGDANAAAEAPGEAYKTGEASGTPEAPKTSEARGTSSALQTHTRFGGIFYLLNAALALELYSDFTAPRGRNLELPPWDWLALVGRTWFGGEFVDDAVWHILAMLSGRDPGEEPGGDFDPPREWVIPGAWLAPWGTTEVVLMSATRTRLRLMHPAGFSLFDVGRDHSLRPLAQARKLCAIHPTLCGATLLRAHHAAPHSRFPATRWLQWLLGYLRARLGRALAIEDVDAVPAVLCRHWARITVGATAVDVSLRLSELPLPIRVAGLDRDPGWIPAAGRTLSFHFV
jgi:hypothetical protein